MLAAAERHVLAGGQVDGLGRAQFDAGGTGQQQMRFGQLREIAAGGALLSGAILSVSILARKAIYASLDRNLSLKEGGFQQGRLLRGEVGRPGSTQGEHDGFPDKR